MDPSKHAVLVKDRHTLQMEKARLRRLCHSMEEDMDGRLEHVKKHYGAMAFNTFFPQADVQAGIAKLLGHAAKGAFKSSRFKSGLITAVIMVIEIVGAKKMAELIENLFTGKKKTGDSRKEEKEAG